MTHTSIRSAQKCRRQKRKRADVLWTIGCFLLLQFGFAISLKTGIVRLDDGTTFATKAKRFNEQLGDRSDDPFITLAFGSSRIMNGFDAGGLESATSNHEGRRHVAFNFGISGCGNIYSFLALEKLLHENVKPNLVLLEVYPILLVPGAENAWFTANEMRCKNFENTQRYGIESVSRSWWEEWLVPFHTHRFSILNRLSPKLLPMSLRENWAQVADPKGWIAVDKPLQTDRVKNQLAEFVHQVDQFHLGGDSCRALIDTLELCRSHQIECVVVWMPESEQIRDQYSAQMATELGQFLDKVEREWNVRIVNARDWVGDDGFYDSYHLNRDGAQRFTRALVQTVRPSFEPAAVARGREIQDLKVR